MTDTDLMGRSAVSLELTTGIKVILAEREGDGSPFVMLSLDLMDQTSSAGILCEDYDIDGEHLWAFMQAWRAAYDHWKKKDDEMGALGKTRRDRDVPR